MNKIENHKRKNRRKPVKSVNWNISGICNYDCSYCVSKPGLNKKISYPDPYGFLDMFSKKLKGSWRFHLAGSGEPLLVPNFSKIVSELTKMGHGIYISTNFSLPLEKLLEICNVANRDNLWLSVSLHLEFADVDDFFKKAIEVRKNIGYRFSATSVARKDQVSKLKEIGNRFRKEKIRFIMRPERTVNNTAQPFVDYSKKELDIISKFNKKKVFFDESISNLKGKLCLAGSKYFIISEKGDVWRCFPAARHKDKNGYLGNLLKGDFELKKDPSVCPYENCYCRLPITNNLIVDDIDL